VCLPALGPFSSRNKRVIEDGHAHAGLVDELRDAGELVEVDLRHLVGVRVMVRVKARREEDAASPLTSRPRKAVCPAPGASSP
jgi:hypothetical protein